MRVKTPTIIQMEPIECGAVSLAIILAHYHCYIAIDELRERCGVSRDGAKATDIMDAAEYYQLETNAYLLSEEKTEDPKKLIETLKEITLPCIAFWKFNHFLVIEGFKGQKVYINDPATGPRTITLAEFSSSFTGIILTLAPSPNFKHIGTKSSLLNTLWTKLKGSRKDLIFLIIISLLLAIPGLITPIFAKVFMDNILIGKIHYLLRPLIFFMIGTLIINTLMLWLQKNCLLRFYIKLLVSSTTIFFKHILHLPIGFFNNYYTGDITQRIKANNNIASLLSGESSSAIVGLLTIIVFAAVLILMAPIQFALIVFSAAFINILLFNLISRKLTDSNRLLQQESAKLAGVTYNGLQLIETIKAQGMENSFFARWVGLYTKTILAAQSFTIPTQIILIAPSLLTGLTNLLILSLATYSIIQGDLTIGTYLAFSALMLNFLTPLTMLTSSAQSFKSAEANVERLNDVLRYKPDPRFIPTKELAPQSQLSGKIEIQNLIFGYNRLATPLIKDFSLTILPGSRIALVGTTGSGKSTIFNLISGCLTPWQGKILFDNQEIRNLPKEVIRQSLGIVNQEIFLFEGNIRDNITLWDETITDQQIIQALEDTCIADISELRGGLSADVKEGGSNFSVGQLQRFEIARALVRNPSILLLDEAYSALDPKTELAIDQNIRRRGCTCIIVAHRLSTIRDCDEIIALDNGLIQERGQHEELLAKNGFYAELIRGLMR